MRGAPRRREGPALARSDVAAPLAWQQHTIDDVNNAIGLVHISNADAVGIAVFIIDEDGTRRADLCGKRRARYGVEVVKTV